MFRGGSFDRSGAGPELHEEWKRRPTPWNRTWSPQGCGARRCWQCAVSNGFLNGTDVVSIVASPRGPIGISRNHVHMFAKHHGSNCEDEHFPNTTFFGVDVANM